MRTEDFANLVACETDASRLWEASTRWLEEMGFDRVLHLDIKGAGKVAVQTTLGRAFETHYQDERLERHDPFLTYCLRTPDSLGTGVDYIDDYSYLSAAEKSVIYAASETGYRAGFSCVVRMGPMGCEAWNVGSTLARAEIEAIRRERGPEIRLGLLALRGRLGAPASTLLGKLTARERACLDLLSSGLRTKAIAHDLGLALVTVELHLRNARTKLGASTRDQALALYRSLMSASDGSHP